MQKRYEGSGINEDFLENMNCLATFAKNFNCAICLDIVRNPYECSKCSTLYCAGCWENMQIAGKPCVYKCVEKVAPAGKFVSSILANLTFTCEFCSKKGIKYHIYVKHIEVCEAFKNNFSVKDLKAMLSEKEEELDKLKEKTSTANPKASVFMDDALDPETIRSMCMTVDMTPKGKFEMHSVITQDDLKSLKNLIENQGASVLEEISAPGHFWTPIHYAMHYGSYQIIAYLLIKLQEHNILDLAMLLQSKDGRCPLLCLLRSNKMERDQKKQLIQKIMQNFPNIKLSKAVITELKNKNITL